MTRQHPTSQLDLSSSGPANRRVFTDGRWGRELSAKKSKAYSGADAFSLRGEDGRVSILQVASAPCGEGRGPR